MKSTRVDLKVGTKVLIENFWGTKSRRKILEGLKTEL
jgi:DNA mismatch repair ATPase MutL